MSVRTKRTRRPIRAAIRKGVIILLATLSVAGVALGLAVRTEYEWGTGGAGFLSKDRTYWTHQICFSFGNGGAATWYVEHLDGQQTPRSKVAKGTWWKWMVIVFGDPAKGIYYSQSSLTVFSELLLFTGVIFGLYPILAFLRGPVRRRRRKRLGQCIKCEYDLTGNESGVCPECGTAIPGCDESASDKDETASGS